MRDRLLRVKTLLTAYGFLLTAAFVMRAAVSYAGELRDPFMFEPLPNAIVAPAPRPVQILVGILWDAVHPLAIVGDQTVGVGDMIFDWRIVKIDQNGIELQRGDRREFLAPGSSIPLD